MLKIKFLFFFVYITITQAVTTDKQKYTMNIEIVRQKSPTEQFITHGHKMQPLLDEVTGDPRTNDSIALYRFLDDEFYGQIVIGHPGQSLYVSFDTSWDISWVLSYRCSSWKTIGCYGHRLYDHDKSSEYKKDNRPFNMSLGNFNMTGFYSYDNISIAHSNVTTQSFVEMVNVPRNFVLNKADGILGLGLQTSKDYNPFFYTLLKQKKIKNPIFSIYLNRDRQSNRGGNVMLGFVDEKHIHKNRINNQTIPENITYLAVADGLPYWQFKIDKIVVDLQKDGVLNLCKGGCDGIVDTSCNNIIGPQAEIDEIHDKIHARKWILDRYTVNCDTVNKLPKISFVLNGKNFNLTGPEYTVKMSWYHITLCFSAFQPATTLQEQSRWVLGGAFLAEYYSIYEVFNKQIGFVKAAK